MTKEKKDSKPKEGAKQPTPLIKVRKNSKCNQWGVLDDYIYSGLSNQEIADKHNVSQKTVIGLVTKLYNDFTNIRESKQLLLEVTRPKHFSPELLDNNQINSNFLDLLSEDDSGTLTDNELMYCELYHQDQDEIKAIEISGLNKGLRKTRDSMNQYKVSCQLRSFYLRKKPNIKAYLEKLQKERISVIEDGKVFIQSELLSVIEKLKKMDGDRNVSNYLKAIESLGRIMGAYQEKVEITSVSGDSALDAIWKKAQEKKRAINGD